VIESNETQKTFLKSLIENGVYFEDEADDELNYLYSLLTLPQLKQLAEAKNASVVEWVEFDADDADTWPDLDCDTDTVQVFNQNGVICSMYLPGRKWTDSYDSRIDVIKWAYLPTPKEP